MDKISEVKPAIIPAIIMIGDNIFDPAEANTLAEAIRIREKAIEERKLTESGEKA